MTGGVESATDDRISHQCSHDMVNPSPEPTLPSYQDLLAVYYEQQRKISRQIEEFKANSGLHCELDYPIKDQASCLQSDSLDRFRSQILPSLGRQICRMSALSIALDPSQLLEDPSSFQGPNSKLNAIMDAAGEVAGTFDQMKASISSSSKLTDPSHFIDRELTGFRLVRLTRMILQVTCKIFQFFKISHGLTQRVLFATIARIRNSSDQKDADYKVDRKRKQMTRIARSCSKSFDWFIEWCGRSELSIIQDEWQSTAASVGKALRRLSQYEEAYFEMGDGSQYYWDFFYSEPQLELTRLMIPILKLSRLFLNKLSKVARTTSSADRESSAPPVFPQLKPHQMDSLLEVTRQIPGCVDDLIFNLNNVLPDGYIEQEEDDDDDDEADNGILRFLESFSELVECYRDSYDLVLDTCPEVDSSNHPKAWFLTWNEQYHTAAQNVRIACAVYI